MNFDLHNVEIVVPLEELGKLPEGVIDMKNWKYAPMKFGLFTVNVNYGKHPKLKIYPPKVYGDSIAEVLVRVGSDVRHIVALVEREYGCKTTVSAMRITRKPNLHPYKDSVLKDASSKGIQYTGKNIELNESSGSHGDVVGLDAIASYDRMITELPAVVHDLKEQIASHLELIQEWRKEAVVAREAMASLAGMVRSQPKPPVRVVHDLFYYARRRTA